MSGYNDSEMFVSKTEWCVRIAYNPDALALRAGRCMSIEDKNAVKYAIETDGKDIFEVDVPSLDLILDSFDWTTGIDFGHEYDGGGYLIGFADLDGDFAFEIAVEWGDDYAMAEGHPERNIQSECVRDGLNALDELLGS